MHAFSALIDSFESVAIRTLDSFHCDWWLIFYLPTGWKEIISWVNWQLHTETRPRTVLFCPRIEWILSYEPFNTFFIYNSEHVSENFVLNAAPLTLLNFTSINFHEFRWNVSNCLHTFQFLINYIQMKLEKRLLSDYVH